MRDLASVIGFKETVIEGRSFKFTFSRLRESTDEERPAVVGALDMYYLHYYPQLHRKQHVPIHYVLVVGYDDEKGTVFVHDCGHKGVQTIPYDEFEKSLNVKVPGMSRKNTIRMFELPEKLPTEFEVAKKGFSSKAERFLNPPVHLFGVPAMRRLAEEILEWNDKKCFEHMVTYATTPPVLPVTLENSHGMRLWQADVLETLGEKYRVDCWIEASKLFRQSGEGIIELCQEALEQNGQRASEILLRIADIEERAYRAIKDLK
jgi:hypothetical protein